MRFEDVVRCRVICANLSAVCLSLEVMAECHWNTVTACGLSCYGSRLLLLSRSWWQLHCLPRCFDSTESHLVCSLCLKWIIAIFDFNWFSLRHKFAISSVNMSTVGKVNEQIDADVPRTRSEERARLLLEVSFQHRQFWFWMVLKFYSLFVDFQMTWAVLY